MLCLCGFYKIFFIMDYLKYILYILPYRNIFFYFIHLVELFIINIIKIGSSIKDAILLSIENFYTFCYGNYDKKFIYQLE